MEFSATNRKFILLYVGAILVLGLMFFLPSGTLDYYQAWFYLIIVFVPASFIIYYFLKNDPEFLVRRIRFKEKEVKQQFIIKIASLIFLVGFIIPGLDRRFGWSSVPLELVIIADLFVFLGYFICFIVFRENSYAGRTIEVEKGQKVISTGPYSIIRHPMYFGVILMYLATPIALGSYVAFPVFLLVIPLFVFRILNEEEVLNRDLPGYLDYCQKVRYRLIPHIW